MPDETTTTTTTPTSWYESLTPEQKLDPHVLPFKDKPLGEVLRSYTEAQKVLSGSIRLPKPDAPPEEQEKFRQDIYNKLGRPEAPDKYQYEKPKLPDGTPWDAEGEKAFLAEAHKLGLNKAQLQGVLNWYGGRLAQGMEARAATQQETERQLRREWGDTYDRRLVLAQNAANTIGGEEFVKLLEDRGIANHPLVVRTLAAFGETLEEQKIITADLPGEPTVSEAQQRLSAIYADKAHPYWKGDQAAVDEVLKLTRQVMGAKGREVVATFG